MAPSSETVTYTAAKLGGLRRRGVANWMKSAVKPSRKGVFAAKAARAGVSTAAFAQKEKHAGGTLGREATLAATFAKLRPKKKRSLSSRLTEMSMGGSFKRQGRAA